jgi:hypothetical protein
MKIRNSRMFSYPVLSSMYDDYINSSFSISISAKKSIKKMLITIIPNLDSNLMKNLINQNKAELVVHFECGRTRYRKIQKMNLGENNYQFEGKNLNDNIQVVSFIVASTDINNLKSTEFNIEYGNSSFNIEKGSILAISNQVEIPVQKNIYDLSSVESIVSIVTNHDENNNILFELSDIKIRVKLPENVFINYSNLGKNVSNYTPILHSMFVIPALVYALDYIKDQEDWIDIENYLWFKVIKKKCEEKYGAFDRNLIEEKTSIVIAQDLIEAPISEAVNNLLEMSDNEN